MYTSNETNEVVILIIRLFIDLVSNMLIKPYNVYIEYIPSYLINFEETLRFNILSPWIFENSYLNLTIEQGFLIAIY